MNREQIQSLMNAGKAMTYLAWITSGSPAGYVHLPDVAVMVRDEDAASLGIVAPTVP